MTSWIVKEKAAGFTDEMLLGALKNCYSYENHAAHGVENLNTQYAGTLYAEGRPDRLYVIFKDTGGSYWYQSHVLTERGEVDLYEYVFGRKERQTDRRRRA